MEKKKKKEKNVEKTWKQALVVGHVPVGYCFILCRVVSSFPRFLPFFRSPSSSSSFAHSFSFFFFFFVFVLVLQI